MASNNIICNNIFYALGTESTHLNQIKGLENGNQIGFNMYAGNISPPVAWNKIKWIYIPIPEIKVY